MKTIIAGSRDISDVSRVKATIKHAVKFNGLEVTEVVCGCAAGVDEIGKQWAEGNGIPVKQFPADWQKHGKAAGPIRNREMAEYADALIAIWDGKSRGTANMIEEAEKHGLKVFAYRV